MQISEAFHILKDIKIDIKLMEKYTVFMKGARNQDSKIFSSTPINL